MNIGGPLLLIGCGKMGGALLSGWLERGMAPSEATIVEPAEALRAPWSARGIACASAVSEISPGLAPAVIVLAVKPQQMDSVVADLAGLDLSGAVALSIAAGKTIGFFEAGLGDGIAVVRAMPNTPAAVGHGMTVLCANAVTSDAQRTLCGELMSAVGEVAWVEDEGLLDPVTAVSGGGPAYVFLLIETLARAGVEAGLPEELAMRAARVTVAGAGELVRRSEESAATLRKNVSSPGGTTLEALKVLMADDGLQPLMTRAIAAATRRSRELAS